MDWRTQIEQHPNVMLGKPVIKGTRITVELILERFGDGWTDKQLLASFPQLTSENLRAAQAYAAAALGTDEIVFLSETS